MKKILIVAVVTLMLVNLAEAGVITGERLLDEWGFGSNPDSLPTGNDDENQWRYSSSGTAVIWETSQANTGGINDGFNAGTANIFDDVGVVGDADYDINTTKLTGISANWAAGNFSYAGTVTYAANHVIEGYYTITVDTVGGTFLGTSNAGKIHDGPTRLGTGGSNSLLQSNLASAWNVINWDTDPFAGGDGIVYADITDINIDFFATTTAGNGGGTHTEFFTMKQADIQYEATTIPEPATLGLVAAAAGSILFIRRWFLF